MSQCAVRQWWPCHSELQATCCHVTVGAMSQLVAGQWWPCHCGVMLQCAEGQWWPCHFEVMSQCAAGQWWPCHCGGHVTVGSRSIVAMSISELCHSGQQVSCGHVTMGPCHSGQQVSGGHVTMEAMSHWAAGQWWPCHCEALSLIHI